MTATVMYRGLVDLVVKVNRVSARDVFPPTVLEGKSAEPLFPEIERIGPFELDCFWGIESMELQTKTPQGVTPHPMETDEVLRHLKEQQLLQRCLSCAEGQAMLPLGPPFFRRRFGERSVYLWRSACRLRDGGGTHVPVLEIRGDKLALSLVWNPYCAPTVSAHDIVLLTEEVMVM